MAIYSAWTGPLSFTTSCTAIVAPWTQDFETGLFPPACWTLTGTATALWNSSNMLALGISGYGVGAYSAWADFWGVSTGSRDLVSIDYDASGMGGQAVKFDWAYDNYLTNDDELQIFYSTDAGSTWTLLAAGSGEYPTYGTFDLVTIDNGITSEYGSAANPVLATDWKTISFTLPVNANKVKFTAVTDFGNNLFVDNIKIVEPLANDVGTESIDVPATIGAGSFSPMATVKNYGTATQTFSVQMTITGGYTSTKTVTGLTSGATQQVTFDNWNATVGAYTINVCTQLGSDGDPTNDCKSKDVSVFSGSWASGELCPDRNLLR